MDLLSIVLLGGGLTLIWAAVKNKSPLEVVKLLTSGENPTEAAETAIEPFGGGEIPDATNGAQGGSTGRSRPISGSDPTVI
jgi:hypothetical protein